MEHTANGAVTHDFPDLEDESGKLGDPAQTFEGLVNAATDAMTQEEDGNWKLPDDISGEVAFAAKLEKRRRDTQSALAKSDNRAKALEAESNSLRERVLKGAISNLTVVQKEELEDLKSTDADAWLAKKTEYEQSALNAVKEELSTLSTDSDGNVEFERRGEVLMQFLADNPGLKLDDEVFANDLPPRITSKLNEGTITFEEFLAEAKKFLKPKAVIKGSDDKDDDEPDLGKAGGGSTVSEASLAGDAEGSYLTEIY